MKEKTFTVDKTDSLLNVMRKTFSDTSGKKIKSYIKYKMVWVDGKIVTNSSTIVRRGSEVHVFFSKRVIDEGSLDIIYEDKDIIAINKPAGLLSIANSKEKEITAFRIVSDYIKEANTGAKLFVVHRLDQATSGVLLFAKNEKMQKMLQKSWNEIVLKREYVAVVEGKMNKSGTIESYLKMNHFQIVHSTKDKEHGWLAITHYKLSKFKNGYSLLEVNIDTGRRNQIRVHMSESGHPVTGDKKYKAKKNPINRLALHASKLHLVDPRTGGILQLETEAPQEILDLVL